MANGTIALDVDNPAEPTAACGLKQAPGAVGGGLLRADMQLGSYRVLRRLGRGGMGHVFEALHTGLGRKVAIKQLHPRFANDREIIQRFFSEARAVSQLSNDHLVVITDFISQGTTHCYVMELLLGESIGDRLKSQIRFPIRQAIRIAEQTCSVLHAVHQTGIVHRDIKPDNIFLTARNGDRDYVKLLDFGVAKFATPGAGDANLTGTHIRLGTPAYMAPEYASQGLVEPRGDIYALGLIMFEMVTGQRPFVGDSWPELLLKHAEEQPPRPSTLAQVPLPLEDVILGCLAKQPEQRPPTAETLRIELHELAQRLEAPPTNPVLLSDRARRSQTEASAASSSPRATRWLALVAMAVFFVAAGIAVFFYQRDVTWLASFAALTQRVPIAPQPVPNDQALDVAGESRTAGASGSDDQPVGRLVESKAKPAGGIRDKAGKAERPPRRSRNQTKSRQSSDHFFERVGSRSPNREKLSADAFFDSFED